MASTPSKPGQMRILKAVATLLENPGARITIARVAREVGVTDAAIYRHYRSKEDIFQALMDYLEINLLSPLNSVQQEYQDTRRRLEMVFMRYMEFFVGHPGLARIFMGHGASEATGLASRLQMLNAKLRSQVMQMLRYGEAQSDLNTYTTPEQGTELFYGMIIAAAMAQVYDFPQLDVEERWKIYCQAVFK